MASNTALLATTNSEPAVGKRYFFAGSIFLLAAGIAELIAGAIVISDSSGYYIGGVYVGIIAIITASRGLAVYTRSHLIAFGALLVCTIIVAIIGTAIQASNYNFVSTLEACSSHSSTQSQSCSIVYAYYTCTGNSDYYTEAEACAATYYVDNGATNNQCSCVTSDDAGTCYSYTNISDCSKLVTVLSSALQASYAFDLICLFISLIILIFVIVAYSRPSLLQSSAEREAAAQANAHNSTPAITIVQATTVAQPPAGKGANYV